MIFLIPDEWLTDDLMKKIEDNDALFKKLGDRKYMEAVNRFQADPAGAMEQFKDDREIQEFLTAFCKIMGTTVRGRGYIREKGAKSFLHQWR